MSTAEPPVATVEGKNPTPIHREVYSFFNAYYNLLRCPFIVQVHFHNQTNLLIETKLLKLLPALSKQPIAY
jgi:hypothetical protein